MDDSLSKPRWQYVKYTKHQNNEMDGNYNKVHVYEKENIEDYSI